MANLWAFLPAVYDLASLFKSPKKERGINKLENIQMCAEKLAGTSHGRGRARCPPDAREKEEVEEVYG